MRMADTPFLDLEGKGAKRPDRISQLAFLLSKKKRDMIPD